MHGGIEPQPRQRSALARPGAPWPARQAGGTQILPEASALLLHFASTRGVGQAGRGCPAYAPAPPRPSARPALPALPAPRSLLLPLRTGQSERVRVHLEVPSTSCPPRPAPPSTPGTPRSARQRAPPGPAAPGVHVQPRTRDWLPASQPLDLHKL